jgi:hypothetical protein
MLVYSGSAVLLHIAKDEKHSNGEKLPDFLESKVQE